jgi:hypothetical protein
MARRIIAVETGQEARSHATSQRCQRCETAFSVARYVSGARRDSRPPVHDIECRLVCPTCGRCRVLYFVVSMPFVSGSFAG